MHVPAAVEELADSARSKRAALRGVWVRIPPAALNATSRRRRSCPRTGELRPHNSQIARLTGVSRAAIRDWLRSDSKRLTTTSCAACGHDLHEFEQLPARQNGYRLGVYLGDGTVSRFGRVFGLRVFMD